MKYPTNIREEELKNKVGQDFFNKFDSTEIIGNIDFSVRFPQDNIFHDEYLLWAETKKASTDIYIMLAQLILTIGKERPFNKHLPPKFLGCFDHAKIAFIPYHGIQEIFYIKDFDWKVAPSNHDTKEFKQIQKQINKVGDDKTYIFDFEKDDADLRTFIKQNFVEGKSETSQIRIDKNNFITIYGRWLDKVMPTIGLDWDDAKKASIRAADFYLADLLSNDNVTFKDALRVVLNHTMYSLDSHKVKLGIGAMKIDVTVVDFMDGQKAHAKFWMRYKRPPHKDYWDYIIDRRDLLVPQDIREREGSFYTPKIWVELSQKYIADVFGEDWQDEYYIWDCAAGTGNLLAGLTNKYNIWASTLDKADVKIMHDRINNGANLLENHCFQFDFLNDDFSKLPKGLQDIINDEKKREKLIVYINPPYAEATSTATRVGTKENKTGVATGNKTYIKYADKLGKARNELFVQFLARIYFEIPGCKIGEFSTQKALIAPAFKDFRKFFFSDLKKCFIVPANTFDNVLGKFPIGFKVWDTKGEKHFKSAAVDVYSANGRNMGKKTYRDGQNCKYINDWIKKYTDKSNSVSAKLCYVGNDFQNNNKVQICSPDREIIAHDAVFDITSNNVKPASVYFAVRHCIEATWLNNRDQFLYPSDGWEADSIFQNDSLSYMLFHGNNHISSKHGVNHWIPFTEKEVCARDKFDSNFMTDFIKGKIKIETPPNLFEDKKAKRLPALEFSDEAKAVFDAGRKLWKYYHSQPKASVNASLYDIRERFQGRNAKGRMNARSEDAQYTELIGNLRAAIDVLAKRIEPKIYEYGFLKK